MKSGQKSGAKNKKFKGLLFILRIKKMAFENLIDEIGE
jgi:hypothetical protein